jgi:hypothetical protein
MKIFKQSGSAVQVEIFLAFLMVFCLLALGALVSVVYFRRQALPLLLVEATSTSTYAVPTTSTIPSTTVLPTVSASLTPLPGQWTNTPTPLPGQSTKTPTWTPVQRTIAPTLTLTPSDTSVPELTLQETFTPEADENLRQVQIKRMAFQVTYRSFLILHQQLDATPTLVMDEKWKIKMVAALSRLEVAVDQLATVKLPDPNYAVYASYLDQLAAEAGFMFTAYRKGVDRHDSTALQIALVHLKAMDEILIRADQEFRAVKSRLATPAFSPVPSLTPTP